jgi:hypothetical protein
MRALHLAPVALAALGVALAGCVVDNSALAPRTDAECTDQLGVAAKACGNRCMVRTDPATGCASAGCEPCPQPGGTWAFCDGALRCATRPACPAGAVYCEGPTDATCDPLATSTVHCGACGHGCGGGACSGGFCDPVVVPSAVNAKALSATADRVVWLERSWGGDAAVLGLLADGELLTTVPGWNDHVLADRQGALVWSDAAGRPIVNVDNGRVRRDIFTPTSPIRTLAADDSYALFAESGPTTGSEASTALLFAGRDAGSSGLYRFPGESPIVAAAVIDPWVPTTLLVATEAGALRWVDYLYRSDGISAAPVEPAVQLAVWRDDRGAGWSGEWSAAHAFWLDRSGNLWSRRVFPDGPLRRHTAVVGPATGALSLAADADGVYWSDQGRGYVAEWRPAQDDVIHLYEDVANPPVAVAPPTRSGRVHWLDSRGRILGAPR